MKNPALLPLFQELKKILEVYVPPLTVKVDEDGRYDIVSTKAVNVNGRKFEEVYFGAVISQKSYVGFYSMGCYANHEFHISDNLRKLLKGKSCFHIKKVDEELLAALTEMTKQDYLFFEREGYFG